MVWLTFKTLNYAWIWFWLLRFEKSFRQMQKKAEKKMGKVVIVKVIRGSTKCLV